MKMKTLFFLSSGFATVLWGASAQAATVLASFDSRSDTSLADPLSTASTSDLAIGLVSGGRSFRTYLTFDLSGETAAAGETTLILVDRGANENNSSSVAQTVSLFVLSADWDGAAQPGPTGTTLASVSFAPSAGNSTGDLTFSSAELTAAFNNALGGNLYLGISSDLEGTDARSFGWFGSIEDSGFEPTLNYTPVPEPGSGMLVLGGMGLLAFRRSRRSL